MEEEYIEPSPQDTNDKAAVKQPKKPKKRRPNNSTKPSKRKAWEQDESDGPDEPDPLLDPVSIDYEALCFDPKYENTGDVWVWDANDFTLENIKKTGLKNPIVFTGQQDILGIEIPDLDYDGIVDLIEPNSKIDVFDHKSEKTKNMLVKTVAEEIQKPKEERTGPLNMLSLEVSYQRLGQVVQPPRLVKEIDWGNYLFPIDKFKHRQYARVEKYAIMTMAGSYTEFHIDFAGTSVWYHLKKGTKYFFLIEPKPYYLHLYEEFINAYRGGASVGFFGDVINGKCTRVKMTAGQTLILPAGWIHAVYTPEDSLVFGGNYLHSFSIPIQITVRDQETRGQTKKKFTYYCYEQTMWYYVADVVKKALGKDYVRLFRRTDYEDILQKYVTNPEEFSHCCYDIQLSKPEFYDDPHTGEPIQTSFDMCNNTMIPPPVKFNEEYLSQLTSFEKAGLLRVKDVLGDFRSLNLTRRNCKVAEGIRRPRHLLQDFQHVLDHITNTSLFGVQNEISVNTLTKSQSPLDAPNSNNNELDAKTSPTCGSDKKPEHEEVLKQVECKPEINKLEESEQDGQAHTSSVEMKDTEKEDTQATGKGSLEGPKIGRTRRKQATQPRPINSEADVSNGHPSESIKQEDEGARPKRSRKTAKKYNDDDDWVPEDTEPKSRRGKSRELSRSFEQRRTDAEPSTSADYSKEQKEEPAEKKPKLMDKEKRRKGKSVNGIVAKPAATMGASSQPTSPTEHKKPESHTQPTKRRRSYLKSSRESHKHSSKDEEDVPSVSKHPPKHHIDAPNPEVAPPEDLVPLGRKFASNQHISAIRRPNAHITPVAVHGARLNIHIEKDKKDKKPKALTSPRTSLDQQKLFNDMFMSPAAEKRRSSFSKQTSSPSSANSSTLEKQSSVSSLPSPSPKLQNDEIPYTPTRPSLNLSGLHSPLSSSNPYNSSFNFTPGGYDPRKADTPIFKPKEQNVHESVSPGAVYQPPLGRAFPAIPSPHSRKNFKYQHALDQLDDINSILGMDN